MKKTLTTLSLLALSCSGYAANVFHLSADNDLALFSGDSTGTSLTLIHQNDTDWNTNNSFAFTLPATGYLYAAALNEGAVGGFSGGLNGVNIVNTDWEYVDLNTSSFTNFPTALDATYDVSTSEFEAALNGATWLDASTVIRPANTGQVVGVIDENGNINTRGAAHYIVPDGFAIRAFRIGVDDVPTAVPEPASTALLGLSSIAFVLRRRR